MCLLDNWALDTKNAVLRDRPQLSRIQCVKIYLPAIFTKQNLFALRTADDAITHSERWFFLSFLFICWKKLSELYLRKEMALFTIFYAVEHPVMKHNKRNSLKIPRMLILFFHPHEILHNFLIYNNFLVIMYRI